MKILGATLLASAVQASVYEGCNGQRNNNPILDLPAQPLKQVQNGQSWLMKEGNSYVYIGKISGSAYEMGKAYGQLFSEELKKQIYNAELMFPFIAHDMLEEFGVPEAILEYLDQEMLMSIANIMMDINWKIASPWIPERFSEEIRGMAEGSGLPEKKIRRVNILPELTQAHCTVTGVWGKSTRGSRLYHLRGLDWDAFAPINEYPSIIIYEPTEAGSNSFANIGFVGLIGTLTSQSKAGISGGEKVMIPRSDSDYPLPPQITYFGKPWTFVLRDTVQFSNNIVDVYNHLSSAKRTMKIHGGWGSASDNTFRGMDYASNFLYLYDDKNWTHYEPVAHPQMDGVFFFDKHPQPSGDPCIPNILKSQYGDITEETLFRDISGYHQTGDINWVVMDPAGEQLWAAWSAYGERKTAYERPIIHVRLSDFWGKKAFLE